MASIPAVLQIGAGRWGVNHLRILSKLHAEGSIKLIGVYEVDGERRAAVAKEFQVETFADNGVFAKADAFDIVVPTYKHAEIAKMAIASGKDFLVEKPLAQNLKEARELEKLSKGSSSIMMVGHIFRYNPAATFAKKLIAEGALGKIRFMRGRFMGFRYQEHDAGILATTAIHFLYLSSFLHGKTPQAVWAKTEYMFGTKLDDLSIIRLDYGDTFTIVETDYFTPGKWRTFDIIGTLGAAHVDLLNQEVILHHKRHIWGQNRFEAHDGGEVTHKLEFQEPLELEIRHFFECVRTRNKPLTALENGLEVIEVIEAAYESARTDRTVQIAKNAKPGRLSQKTA